MRSEHEAFASPAWQPATLARTMRMAQAGNGSHNVMRLRRDERQRHDDILAWQRAWDELHDADRGHDDGHGALIWRDLQGRPHRRMGPSVIDAGRRIAFHHHGRLHRIGAPATIAATGARQYFVDGVRHRDVGPAIIGADGTQEWWINGRRHNALGAAVIRPNGTREYWVQGVLVDADDADLGAADLNQALFGDCA